MRTPFNATNFHKDIDDICRTAATRAFTSSNDLELAIEQFRNETTPLIIDLYEKYAAEYPGFVHQGDWRVGVDLRVFQNGIVHVPNPQLLNFMNHIKLGETEPLKSYEIFMDDNRTYVVFARNRAEAIQIMWQENPDLTILSPASITEKEIPNKPGVFTVKSQVIL